MKFCKLLAASGASFAEFGHHTPCVAVSSGDDLVVLDAGSGATALGDHQPRVLQHLQMLHHRAAVERGEDIRQLPGGERAIAQGVADPPPRRVRQRLENEVHPVVR